MGGNERYSEPFDKPQGGGTALSQWEQHEAAQQTRPRSRATYGVDGTLVQTIPGDNNQSGGQQPPRETPPLPPRQGGSGTVAGDIGAGPYQPAQPVDATKYRVPTYETHTRPTVFKTGFAGGVGAYLAKGPGGNMLNTAAERVLDTSKPIGNALVGEGSWIAKSLPDSKSMLKPVAETLNKAQTGVFSKGAGAWKAHYSPQVATVAEGAVAGESAAASVASGGTASSEALSTAKNILSKPGVQTFLKGALVAGGTIAADNIIPGPKDDYHLSSLGVPLAMVYGKGNMGTMAWVAGGSLAAGKLLNTMLPAEDHPHLANIMKPGFLDTALVTGSAFLPLDTKGKLAAMGGSWVFGRMTNMTGGESALAGAGLAGLTYRMTKSPALSIGVGAGSWALSRVF